MRRQAKLDPEDYQVFAADLEEYDLRDIEAGLTALGKEPRRERDTAFPSLGTLTSAIKIARRMRRDAEYAAHWRKQNADYESKVRAERAAGTWNKTDEEIAQLTTKVAMP